jgi:hypothetical protein
VLGHVRTHWLKSDECPQQLAPKKASPLSKKNVNEKRPCSNFNSMVQTSSEGTKIGIQLQTNANDLLLRKSKQSLHTMVGQQHRSWKRRLKFKLLLTSKFIIMKGNLTVYQILLFSNYTAAYSVTTKCKIWPKPFLSGIIWLPHSSKLLSLLLY